jgi:ribonuclease Z
VTQSARRIGEAKAFRSIRSPLRRPSLIRMNMPVGTSDRFQVTLLGTGAPPPLINRFGPSTLVEVGGKKFLFDAGRGAMQRLYQLKIPFGDINGIFLTHHHSDHLVGFTDLWLTGWLGRPWGKRSVPLLVWGPAGTRQMVDHLPLAFETDLRIRSRVYPAQGAKLEATEITEGVVFDDGGIKVSAFEVDHGEDDLLALGYRIDYNGFALVLSGDTTFSENLIKHSYGADVLVHEVAYGTGPAVERQNLERISRNHTLPEQAGEIFDRVAPRLAVYTHLLLFGDAKPEDLIPATRVRYAGPLVVGEDLMRIEIGSDIQIIRFGLDGGSHSRD